MKKLPILFLLFGILISNSTHINAQSTTIATESFKVEGNCDMCKSRIEKAAKSAGAQRAVWNADSKVLVVAYDKDKLTIDAIHQSIANAGYDTDKIKAPDKKYKALPACCQYERPNKTSTKTK